MERAMEGRKTRRINTQKSPKEEDKKRKDWTDLA
jgi:hypothetical protein